MSPHELVFFYDLGRPECYLAAERIMAALPLPPEWEPVLGAEFEPEQPDRESVERRAARLGLLPFRWPTVWPPDTRRAMLTATFAKQAGRAVAFSLAAFRQAFAGGRDLGEESTVLLAAAAGEMHPAAVLKGIQTRAVRSALAGAGARASDAGVRTLPAVLLDAEVFSGPTAVEQAARALAGRSAIRDL
ncbi:MAG: DsbA family protein [Solirubrobacteraceae bacterium]